MVQLYNLRKDKFLLDKWSLEIGLMMQVDNSKVNHFYAEAENRIYR